MVSGAREEKARLSDSIEAWKGLRLRNERDSP